MLDNFGVPAALHDQALVAVDKRDKIGVDGVRKDLAARGIADAAADRLVAAFADRAGLSTRRRSTARASRVPEPMWAPRLTGSPASVRWPTS